MKHQLALLDNAIDSLSEALQKYELGAHNGEPGQLKFAILHMAHFIELLLKKRLSDIHPLLIYARPFDEKLKHSQTITITQAINFLKHADELEPEFHDDLKWLRDLRNKITHHEFEIDTVKTKDYLGRIVRAAYDFCDDNAIGEIESLLNSDALTTFKGLLDDYTEKLKLAKVDAEEHSVEFGPFEDLHGHPAGPFDCGMCGEEEVVAATAKPDDSGFPCKCFLCDQSGWFVMCGECTTWFPDWDLVDHPYTDQQTVCEACSEYLSHKHDDD